MPQFNETSWLPVLLVFAGLIFSSLFPQQSGLKSSDSPSLNLNSFSCLL